MPLLRLEQVLWALLDNAVRYSTPGSVIGVRFNAVNATTGAGLLSEGVSRDEGIGMSAATRMRASEQLLRSDDARRLAPHRSGVGHYPARGLVEAMGGSLCIDCQPGAGSTVTIRPRPRPREEATAEAAMDA